MEKERVRHTELGKQRQMLVRGGKPTERLETALRQVFSLYEDPDQPETGLGVVVASRLWYRSGLKLKNLADLLERKAIDANCLYADVFVLVDDFLEVVSAILTEDEIFFSEIFDISRSIQLENPSREQFEVSAATLLVANESSKAHGRFSHRLAMLWSWWKGMKNMAMRLEDLWFLVTEGRWLKFNKVQKEKGEYHHLSHRRIATCCPY